MDTFDVKLLIEKYLQGDKDSFEELYTRFKGYTYSVLLRMFKSVTVAEDLNQNTWFNISKGLHAYKRESKFSTWIYSIAQSEARQYFRKQKQLSNQVQYYQPSSVMDANQINYLIINEAVKKFSHPPTKRETCFLLCVVLGYTKPEAATKLGITPGAVGKYIHQVREKIRRNY